MRDSKGKCMRKGSRYDCKSFYMDCREVLEVKRIDCLMDSKKPHTIKYRAYYLLVMFMFNYQQINRVSNDYIRY